MSYQPPFTPEDKVGFEPVHTRRWADRQPGPVEYIALAILLLAVGFLFGLLIG